PALAEFPTDYHSNWQWSDAMRHGQAIKLDALAHNLQPIVRVIDDWFTNRSLGLIFEVSVGAGKLLVTGIDLLTNAAERPEAKQLLHSLKKYAASDAFQPDGKVEVAELKGLFRDSED
ncbi:MAG: hypothetical protein OEQ53_08145, partial [Saprospiraceae bacterium]|nr:hypothetical protein [Saprospiraceae bacterium]